MPRHRENTYDVTWPRPNEDGPYVDSVDLHCGDPDGKFVKMVEELAGKLPSLSIIYFVKMSYIGGLDVCVEATCDVTGMSMRFLRGYEVTKNSFTTRVDCAVLF